MIEREEAIKLVEEHVTTKNLVKHMLACEACMRQLAKRMGHDEEVWGLTGLLHDLDYEETKDKPDIHGKRTVEILGEVDADLPEEAINAILAHNKHKEPETPIEWALYAVDPTSGFIVACALMHPDKRLNATDTDFCLRRFGEKSFARGASREQIETCKNLGLTRDEFIELCLSAMQGISDDLGL